MSLSVCLITADPAARIATALEPLRAHAQEVLIAADSRVGDETLAEYREVADRVFRIEFVRSERLLAWLCAQCSGDWILQLDGDELLSSALVTRLPQMLESRDVRQFWIRRAWVYPDPAQILAEIPWSEDFVNRLVRNDGTLRIRGQMHSQLEPVAPREYVQEPLYHLDLLTRDHSERLDKVIRYEVERPRLLAAGGGRLNEAFYLPELRHPLALHRVPAEDEKAIVRAFEPSSVPASPSIKDVPLVKLAETDRMWEGRTVAESAYRSRIEPREPALSLAPAERRHVMVRVSNEGSERWPAGVDEHPQIRLSYRWLHPDGRIHTPDGPRSAFPRPVGPGESILAPLHVDAPDALGQYTLEVDVVHENVRWFGCARRVPARVEHPRGPPPGARLKETAPPSFRRWRRVRIPATFHRIWLGSRQKPEEHEHFAETFARHHPSWEMRLWTDEDLPELEIGTEERGRARTPSELSNLVRYEVLHRHGGVYVDTDVECRRPLTPLLKGIDAFAGLAVPGRIGSAILGAVARHPVYARAARLARQTLGSGVHSPDATGPGFLSLIVEQQPANFAIFAAHLFYPYLWDEPERRHELFPEAYAVHHWTLSWLKDDP